MRALRPGTYQVVPGEYYGTPKEVWGFLAPARAGRPELIAFEFLTANRDLLGIETRLGGLRFTRSIESLGARHVILQQLHEGLRVHRAYVTVHMDLRGRVYLAKNRAVPGVHLPPRTGFRLGESECVTRARRRLPRPGRRATVLDTEAMWYPYRDRLEPTWKVRIARTRPREEWIVYVNARTGGVLSKVDNLAAVRGRARIFDPSPVTTLGDHRDLVTPSGRPRAAPDAAYRSVRLARLIGNGRLDGTLVSTRATAGRTRILRRDHDFRARAGERGFLEAMAYYHVDAALRYLQELGYTETRAIFGEPLEVDVTGTRLDNSWYSPWERRLTFGTGYIDDAEDGETIVHELGHAIQDAICPDFGQSAEAAAMGEGFGDYLAASFFADRKPPAYRVCVMTWDGLLLGLDEGLDPPCLRRLDSGLTYRSFDEDGDEHENGVIWSATLWEIHEGLGRTLADTLILESHFQQDGFTSFARGARAILDADRNLYRNRHRTLLRGIFERRQIGPV
ncbi:MAG: M36 family metallopeptidase [Gemmatimonadota bacterium]